MLVHLHFKIGISVIPQLSASLLLLTVGLFKVTDAHRRFLFDFLGLRMVDLLRGIGLGDVQPSQVILS